MRFFKVAAVLAGRALLAWQHPDSFPSVNKIITQQVEHSRLLAFDGHQQ